MVSAHLPTVLQLLNQEPNRAADTVLVETLSQLEDHLQPQVLDMVARRGNLPAMATLVQRFGSFDKGLQAKIVARAAVFSPALRQCLQSADISVQAAAVAVIVHSGFTPLALALADALKRGNERSRRLAGKGLCRLSERIFADHGTRRHGAWFVPPPHAREHVGEALARAVHYWEFHRQHPVLEAALLFPHWTIPAIRKELARTGGDLGRAILSIVECRPHARLAEFAVRSLDIPRLWAPISAVIGSSERAPFVRGLLDCTWLLDDPGIARGLRRMRALRWMAVDSDTVFTLNPTQCRRAVRWLSGLAGSARERVGRFRTLAQRGLTPINEAIAAHLVVDASPEASALLGELLDRLKGGASRIVESELRKRGMSKSVDCGAFSRNAGAARNAPAKMLVAYADLLDADGAKKDALRRALVSHAAQLPPLLRRRLAFGTPAERCKTMRVIRQLGVSALLVETIYRLAFDADATVRSTAVALLADLKGRAAKRIVRQAINDTDPRVQANALEVLDDWEELDRVVLATPKLDSTQNRVRAVAIHTLLPLEVGRAGDALLDMLAHPSRSHRMSALWVVKQLRLRSLAPRVSVLGASDPDSGVRRRAAELNGWLVST